MRFNELVVGLHPATSGYELEFFVQNTQETEFLSGSGSFFVDFPRFAVTDLEFRGQNIVLAPTGSGLQFMSDIELITNFVELKCNFSGDLNGFIGLAKENIKFIDVYTGSYAGFEPDTVQLTNHVKSNNVKINKDDENLTIDILSEDIQGRADNLFYKIIPSDYLTFGQSSSAVSGIMFTGFPSTIDGEIIIDRSNGNDLRFASTVTDIFNQVNIVLTKLMKIALMK